MRHLVSAAARELSVVARSSAMLAFPMTNARQSKQLAHLACFGTHARRSGSAKSWWMGVKGNEFRGRLVHTAYQASNEQENERLKAKPETVSARDLVVAVDTSLVSHDHSADLSSECKQEALTDLLGCPCAGQSVRC